MRILLILVILGVLLAGCSTGATSTATPSHDTSNASLVVRLTLLEQQTAQLQQRIRSLEGQVNNLGPNDLDSLARRVSALESKVSSPWNNLDSLARRVSALESKVNNPWN